MEHIGAFAFKELYQDLFAVTGAEFIPTYDNREGGILTVYSMAYSDSPSGRIETNLILYLSRGTDGKNETSDLDLIRTERARCKQRLSVLKATISRLDNHIRRLKSYEREIFAQVLSNGLNDDLRRRGTRATDLIRKYEWLLRLFSDFETILSKDFADISEYYQAEFRRNFGRRLKLARMAAGLSQKQLGEILAISHRAVSNWETGIREPDLEMLVEITNTLSRPLEWLLDTE